jgi:hypothetical protein
VTIDLLSGMMKALPIQDLTYLGVNPMPIFVIENVSFRACAAALGRELLIEEDLARAGAIAAPNRRVGNGLRLTASGTPHCGPTCSPALIVTGSLRVATPRWSTRDSGTSGRGYAGRGPLTNPHLVDDGGVYRLNGCLHAWRRTIALINPRSSTSPRRVGDDALAARTWSSPIAGPRNHNTESLVRLARQRRFGRPPSGEVALSRGRRRRPAGAGRACVLRFRAG